MKYIKRILILISMVIILSGCTTVNVNCNSGGTGQATLRQDNETPVDVEAQAIPVP